jgi:hypothetical protein
MTSILVTVAVPPQLSVVVILPGAGGGTKFAQLTVTSAGQADEGGILSNTVIIWTQVAVFPHKSDAWYVLLILNRFAQVRLTVTSLKKPTITAPPQLSLPVMLPVFTCGTRAAQLTVTSAGHIMDGTVLSNTVIV